MFNKKFEDKYPNVRRPIICNGLKVIKPYKHHVIDIPKSPKIKTTISFDTEPEPEPEP
jgi:hypothetical protein